MPDSKRSNGSAISDQHDDWAQGLRDVPDLLVSAEFSLRPLARGDIPVADLEARRIVGDVCDRLHRASGEVLELMRHAPGLSPRGGEGPAERVADLVRGLRILGRAWWWGGVLLLALPFALSAAFRESSDAFAALVLGLLIAGVPAGICLGWARLIEGFLQPRE